jgi:hypothetical protein
MAATFARDASSCVIDENPSHRLCRDGKEVRPVAIRNRLAADEANAEFIHDSIWFERVIAAFSLQKAGGDLPKMGVDNGKQAVARLGVAVPPPRQPTRDFGRR